MPGSVPPGEATGRLACLLAARADCVVQMFCGIPTVLKGGAKKMLIYLLRHGLTEYNAQKALSGPADIPLSPGAAQLRKADFDPMAVYHAPLQHLPAKIVFPHTTRGGGRPQGDVLWRF